jgi:hypothetical protein
MPPIKEPPDGVGTENRYESENQRNDTNRLIGSFVAHPNKKVFLDKESQYKTDDVVDSGLDYRLKAGLFHGLLSAVKVFEAGLELLTGFLKPLLIVVH